MSEKPIPTPYWWKNTYFWIAGVLAIIGIVGLIGGENMIRDPGQKRENFLSLIYFGGAIVMLVNGILSHRQTVQHFEEQNASVGENTDGSV